MGRASPDLLNNVPKKYQALVDQTHELIEADDPDPSYSVIRMGVTHEVWMHDLEVARRITEDSPILIQTLEQVERERGITEDCVPRIYQDVQAIAKTNTESAYELFEHAPLLISKTGMEGYVKIADYLRQDKTAQERFKTQVEECFGLQPHERFLHQQQNAKHALQTIRAGPDRSADELLIGFIHDQHSAHEIGKLIDKEKYGKEYAEKCGRFY